VDRFHDLLNSVDDQFRLIQLIALLIGLLAPFSLFLLASRFAMVAPAICHKV